jgi:hypothetical protein
VHACRSSSLRGIGEAQRGRKPAFRRAAPVVTAEPTGMGEPKCAPSLRRSRRPPPVSGRPG